MIKWSGAFVFFALLLSCIKTKNTSDAKWGHVIFISGEYQKSYLFNALYRDKTVRVCIKDDDLVTFPLDSMQLQITRALGAWFSQLTEFSLQDSKVTFVDCATDTQDVKVEIGIETQYPLLDSYQLPEKNGGHYFSRVKINTAYRAPAGSAWKKILNTQTLLKFSTLKEFETSLSDATAHALSVANVATKYGVNKDMLFMTSFPILVHELGHSFGLCDMYEGQLQNCDPEHMTNNTPDSVMKSAANFAPIADDITGIKEIFRRFNAPR